MMGGGGVMNFATGSMPSMPTGNSAASSSNSNGNVVINQTIQGGSGGLDAKKLAQVAQQAVIA